VLDGDTAPLPKKGAEPPYPPIFGPCLLRPNGCMGQDATWYGGRPLVTRHCVRWGPSSPSPKAAQATSQFSANVRCGQTAGWMKTPLGTEVDLGSRRIALDGVPAIRERGTAAPPPLFGPCLLWPRSPISATAELLFKLPFCHTSCLNFVCDGIYLSFV